VAVVFPTGLEVFANAASCIASGSSGTTNPGAGVTESWTMSTGSTSFPAASNTVVPNNYFYIRDPADTTNEIVLVYNTSGTSWNVQRGMSGATVAHATGATWVQVIAPYTLANFKQTPGATTSSITYNTSTTITQLATYTPLATDVNAGAAWELVTFGPITTSATLPALTFTIKWGSATLLTLVTGVNGSALVVSMGAGSSFDLNGSVTLLTATSAVANMNFFSHKTTTSINCVASTQSPVSISGNGPITLSATWNLSSATNSITAQAPMIYRAA
jgi:hypothetical protein